MCSKCPPWALTQAERRRRHWLMAATTIEWSSFIHLTNSLCFSSARRHYYVSAKGITGFVGNATAVVSWVDTGNKFSNFFLVKFYECWLKFMLKILWMCVCFCGSTRCTFLSLSVWTLLSARKDIQPAKYFFSSLERFSLRKPGKPW